MKRNLCFYSVIFLGVSMIISSYIISRSLNELANKNDILNASLTGSLSVSNMESYKNVSDVLQTYDAGIMLGYEQDNLIQDIKSGKLEGIPYIEVGDHYIFSKKALEEWVYNRALN